MDDWKFDNYYLWRNKHAECGGENQSPININSDELVECNLMCDIETLYKPSECRIKYDKHNMVTLEYDLGSYLKMNEIYYSLRNIYIHTPSLHTIDNERFDVEIIMVHKSDNNAKDNPDKGVITCKMLNRFNREYGPDQDFLNEFIFKTPKEPISYFKKIPVSKDWNVELLTPKEKSSFYMYDGSLPFPDCAEGYKIIVYEEIGNIGNTNFNLLKENIGSNTRPVQMVGNRKVFYNPGKNLKETPSNRDIVTDDKFLKCVKTDEDKPKPIIKMKTFLDEKLDEKTFNRIKVSFMLVAFISLVVLGYFFVLYLYKMMYVQKMFKVFLPGEVLTSQQLKQWTECSSDYYTDPTTVVANAAANAVNAATNAVATNAVANK